MRTKAIICALAVLFGVPVYAQTDATTTNLLVVGSTNPADAPTGAALMRIIGNPTIGSASGTLRPLVLDSNGNAWTDSVTGVSTGGVYTFGSDHLRAGSGAGNAIIRINGGSGTTNKGIWWMEGGVDVGQIQIYNSDAYFDLPGFAAYRNPNAGFANRLVIDASGHVSAYGSLIARGGTLQLAALGVSNARAGVVSGSPRVVLEQAGVDQWEIDNVNGMFRLVRMNAAGVVDNRPLQIDGNINLNPLGRRMVPVEQYGVDFGSQQYKIGALWVGDLMADRLVTIENIGTIDNRWLIGSGNAFDADMSPAATTMITRYNNFVNGTYAYAQKFGKTEVFKVTSGPTLTNLSTNSSFEGNSVSSWGANPGQTLSATNAKSYHGEYSMLVDVTTPSSFLHAGALTPGVTYTTCAYARRVDGAAMATGDVQIYHANEFIGVAPQPTTVDGWYRFCRTSVAGNVGGGSQQTHFSVNADMYFDAVQTEATTVERPYSAYRASYTILRNVEASSAGANQWFTGDGLFSLGANAGDGWIDCYAIRGIRSLTEQGPSCVVNVRTSAASWISYLPHAAWGNLNGIYGYSTNTFGFAAGPQGDDYLTIDAANGFRLFANGVNTLHVNSTAINIGRQIAGEPQVNITPTQMLFCSYSVACSIRLNGSDGSITITGSMDVGTAGALKSGATGYDTGTGYWLAYNGGLPQMRIGTPTTDPTPNYLRYTTGGALEVRSNRFRIDSNGVGIGLDSGVACNASQGTFRFEYGDGLLNGLNSCDPGVRLVTLNAWKAGENTIQLTSNNTAVGSVAGMTLSAATFTRASQLRFTVSEIYINGVQGYTGTKVMGACTVFINDGIVTNVAGC